MPAYQPARLIKGSSRWYISFYVRAPSGEQRKYRPTFNLNRIYNLKQREERGLELTKKINWWLENGKPIDKFDERKVVFQIKEVKLTNPKLETPILEAIEIAKKIKCSSDREETNRTYSSICHLFSNYLHNYQLNEIKIGEFEKPHAVGYMDHCTIDRKVGSNTYNNNLREMRTIFNVLLDRGYVLTNFFKEINYKPKAQKKRRNFELHEAKIVIAAIREKSPMLFYALIFLYACFIRPAELRRLRFRDIDIKEGTIYLKSDITKSRKDRFLTIPTQWEAFFKEAFFTSFPRNYLIFGKGFQPHPSKPCGWKTMYNRHRNILLDLKKRGKLEDITGLQWYSWKDSGITDAIEEVGLMATSDQAGHENAEMTLRYRHKKRVNEKMKAFPNKLIEVKNNKQKT